MVSDKNRNHLLIYIQGRKSSKREVQDSQLLDHLVNKKTACCARVHVKLHYSFS